MRKMKKIQKVKNKPDNTALQNYMALVAIVPAVVSVLAYELVDFLFYKFYPERVIYDPINGIAILVPMALMMELLTFFFSRNLLKKTARLTDAIREVADGNFEVSLPEKNAAPYKEVYHDFNRMTMELSGVQTMRSDFINNFSHEFKTPISSIYGFARLLLDTQVSEEERREYLEIIAEESGRLTHLAEETMFLSKLDSQQLIEGKKMYSLDRQIRQTVILLQTSWETKGITPEIQLPKLYYYGNAELMSHVWINLLNNAVKFTSEHGSIFIEGKNEQDMIVITIRDTGIGMTEEETRQVFQRYYQADRSHSGNGLGLGLSIVYRIIELCGGEILVASTKGVGTCFTVKLPNRNKEQGE